MTAFTRTRIYALLLALIVALGPVAPLRAVPVPVRHVADGFYPPIQSYAIHSRI